MYPYLYLQLPIHLSIECQIENDTLSFGSESVKHKHSHSHQYKYETQIQILAIRWDQNQIVALRWHWARTDSSNQGQYSFGVRRSGNKLLEQLHRMGPGEARRGRKRDSYARFVPHKP